MVHWIVSGFALIVALLAWGRGRRLSRKIDHLTQQYWELRYQHGVLKARVDRLDPEAEPAEEPAAPPAGQTFIPLSSLKR